MYVLISKGLGDDKVSKPKSLILAMRPKPYLILDRFDFDKPSLTARLKGMVNDLAQAVTQSWGSNQPITAIRLIGHTDSTGAEKYNIGLGDRRAQAVETVLQDKLKGLLSRVKIVVGPSPGESEPRTDNRTREGKASNRTVEVFVTITSHTKPKKPLVDLRDVKPPPDPIIRTTPDPYWQPVPSGEPRGKSLSDWLDEKLARLPPWLRTRLRDAVVTGACSTLAVLLEQAGLSGADKEALKAACKATAQTKSR